MLVYSYQMFRTPLDDEYKNVYDNYTSVSEYLSFLTTYSPAKTGAITVPTISRSVKSINGDIVLPINQFRADEIERNGYNYVSVLASPEATVEPAFYRFYFIQKIESLNDNHDSSLTNLRSCKLFLKYDAWTNNYLDNIKNSEHQQQCERLSIDHGYTTTEDPGHPVRYIWPKTDKLMLKPLSKSLIENSRTRSRVGSDLLSLGVRFVGEKVVSIDPYTASLSTPVAGAIINIMSQHNAPVVYFPLMYIDDSAEIETPISVKDKFGNICVSSKGDYIHVGLPSWINSAYVLNCWVTFYGCVAKPTVVSNVYNLKGDLDCVCKVTVKDVNDNGDEIETEIVGGVTSPYLEITHDIELDNVIIYNTDSNLKGYDNLKQREEGLNIYPFVGKELIVNGNSLPLSMPDIQTVRVTIYRENSTTPHFKLEAVRPQGAYSTSYFTINSQDYQVAKFTDSLELYYINNSSVRETQIAQNITKMFSSFGFGMTGIALGAKLGSPLMVLNSGQNALNGMSDSLFGLLTIMAQAQDADHSLDTYSMPSSIGTDSFYLDGIYILNVFIDNESIKRNYFYEIHCNGDYVSDSSTVGAVVKSLFDCIKTINCSLPDIPILAHRKEIESACNRGIRKFHIDAENKDALIACEAEYNNYTRGSN